MKDFLTTIFRSDESRNGQSALYSIETPDRTFPNVRRLLMTTPQTRAICNEPLISGQQYKDLLTSAILSVLKDTPVNQEILDADPHGLIVLYILSGGLTFDIQAPLYELGLNCTISMQSEQRLRKPDGRWEIYKNSYAKRHIPKYIKNITLFAGDVCASGKSLCYGLGFQIAQFLGDDLKEEILGELYRPTDGTLNPNDRITRLFDNACDPANPDREKVLSTLLERLEEVKQHEPGLFQNKLPFSDLYFFTIGGHRAEIVLINYEEILRILFPDSFQRITVIYFEDRFDCIHKKNDAFNKSMTIHFGTDLLKRKNHLPAPEYERSVFQHAGNLINRCSIYDCGSRRFDWQFHYADLLCYFAECARLGKSNYPAMELITEKYYLNPMKNESSYIRSRKSIWPDLERNSIRSIFHDIHKTLSGNDLDAASTLTKLSLQHIIDIINSANYGKRFENKNDLKMFIGTFLNFGNESIKKRNKHYRKSYEALAEIFEDLCTAYFNSTSDS